MANPTSPAPSEEPRQGDSAFLPVVIAAGVALIVILLIAVFLLHGKGTRMVPKSSDQQPPSQTMLLIQPLPHASMAA